VRACRVKITNFRGHPLFLLKHGVLIGDNNTGKTTIFEALDLVLGVDRLNRQPAVDEHDFFRGKYRANPPAAPADADPTTKAPATDPTATAAVPEAAPRIEIEVTVADLSDEQKSTFGDFVEFWDSTNDEFYEAADPGGVDPAHISEALRITFHGWYDEEEDDFEGRTFFTRSLTEGERPEQFSRNHKQVCGFLYLRSHRTGSRALSLERGSLLDIILRLKELRPQMWEDTLSTLSANRGRQSS
jgi:putative ATP-dependent endonuclease of the OLD family